MKRLLIIGCGDVALRTIPLLQGHYRLYGLIRNHSYSAKLRAWGVTPVIADLDNRTSLTRISGLADVVLHYAPPAPQTSIDTRTHHLLAALSAGKLPKQLIYISTSGVYGDCVGNRVSETTPLNPQTNRALLRLDAERRIRAWAKRNNVHANLLRVPGIYAQDRLPLDRLRAGSPAIVTNDDGYSNHIHADDLAHIVVAALRYGKANRVYHTVDEDEMKIGDYFDAVADAFNLPRPPRLSREEVRQRVSPMMWSFMNESRRMTDTRMKQELKVKLLYPTLAHTLASRNQITSRLNFSESIMNTITPFVPHSPRAVEQIIEGIATSDGAGVKLTRVLTGKLQHRLDPFLMLDAFGSDNPDDYIAGFPDHPHRGFETVTYMLAGRMRHRDSAGNEGLLENGGVQWMTAGRGVIHSEIPEQKDGVMEGFQLWLNLPASRKMAEPWYRDIASAEIPEYFTASRVKVRVIAGGSNGVSGVVTREITEPIYLDVHLPAGAEFSTALPNTHNAFIYVYRGTIKVGETTVPIKRMGILRNFPEDDGVILTASENARVILVAGKPLNEPIVQYGPFVMNTQQEVEQAVRDFRSGRLA